MYQSAIGNLGICLILRKKKLQSDTWQHSFSRHMLFTMHPSELFVEDTQSPEKEKNTI